MTAGAEAGRYPAASARQLRFYGLVIGAGIALLYLLWSPASPDLAAQNAWATMVRHVGLVPVFGRWFGGVTVGSYSLLVPLATGELSIRVVGALSAILSVVLGVPLLNGTRWPRLGLVCCAICVTANLLSGRVTFAVGVAIGLATLSAINRGWRLGSAVLSALCYSASPVAAIFLLIPIGSIVLTNRAHRSAALSSAAGLALAAIAANWLFPLAGYEPFSRSLMLICVLIQLAIAAAPVPRGLRIAALLGAVFVVATYGVHSSLGGNVARLPILVMPAVVIANLAARRAVVLVAAAALLAYPVIQSAGDVVASHDRSASPTFASGLVRRLSGDPVAERQRIEVVDARTHWGTVRLADAGFAVSRGWLTQVDEVDNPIFYGSAPLTASSYRSFLDRTASGYVALEQSAPLDGSAEAEAALVRHGLPYLSKVWSDSNWSLYEVENPQPLAVGAAQVVEITETGLILQAQRPGLVALDLNWSPYLTVTGGRIIRHGRTAIAILASPGRHVVSATWRSAA